VEKSNSKRKSIAATLLVFTASFFIHGSVGGFLSISSLLFLTYLLLKEKEVVKTDISGLVDKVLLDSEGSLDPISKYAALTYFIFLITSLLYYGVSLAPDHMLFIGLFGAALLKKTRTFIDDWIPYILLLISYDALRGVADRFGGRVIFQAPIFLEKLLFNGVLPTAWLQEKLLIPGVCSWLDQASIIFYMSHFMTLMVFSYFLWIQDRNRFKHFRAAVLVTSYMALITFLIIPVAPPWLAAEEGFINALEEVGASCTKIYTAFQTIYLMVNSNPVAAVPSLHLGYPWLIMIYAFKYYRWKSLPFFILPLGVGFSAVYMGEHYVVDLLAGIIYAHIGSWLVEEKLSEHLF